MGETIFKKLFPFFVLQICRNFAIGIKKLRMGFKILRPHTHLALSNGFTIQISIKMKKIFKNVANEALVEEVVSTKVDAQFIDNLKKVFGKFPDRTVMRFRQDPSGRLIIRVEPTYVNGITQVVDGYGDADLINTILSAGAGMLTELEDYHADEHDIEIAAEGEDPRLEILKQFLTSGRKGTIEPNWKSRDGKTYRRISYLSPHNMEVRFCLEATEDVSKLLDDACKPEWMQKEQKNEQETA